MFNLFGTNPAATLLKDDHERVKAIFDRVEAAKGRVAKVKLVRDALTELKAHAAIEEELFHPAVRETVGKDVRNEADEEHHVAKLLVAELGVMDGTESHFDAKFTVLAEIVCHHIEEEERDAPEGRGGDARRRGARGEGDPAEGDAPRRRRDGGRGGADGEGVTGDGRLARGRRAAEAAETPEAPEAARA